MKTINSISKIILDGKEYKIGLEGKIKLTGIIIGESAFNESSDLVIDTSGEVANSSTMGLMSAADKIKLDGIATGANAYSLPLATASVRGGVKIGYAANGKNYPVQLSNEQMYVNVPWTDTNTTYSAATNTAAGLMSAADKIKLDGIATGANKITIANNLTTTTAGSALDATQGKALNDKVGKINLYVGDSDGKLHFVNGAGADTVLPFSGSDVKLAASARNTSTSASSKTATYTAEKDGKVIIVSMTTNANAAQSHADTLNVKINDVVQEATIVTNKRLIYGIYNVKKDDVITCYTLLNNSYYPLSFSFIFFVG